MKFFSRCLWDENLVRFEKKLGDQHVDTDNALSPIRQQARFGIGAQACMQLYHLTVRRPDYIDGAVLCSLETLPECLVLVRGQWLEVLSLSDGELALVSRTPTFGTIKSISKAKSPDFEHDLIVLASEAGTLSILKFDAASGTFVLLSSQQTSLPGLRREFPGEYLAVDPRGRAIMSASIEKVRTVSVLQDTDLSPPVNAVLPSTFCYAVSALDRNYDSPAFACLERFRFSKKQLAVYEFSLGLNHIEKSWTHEVSDTCDIIIATPAGIISIQQSSVVLHDSSNGSIIAESQLSDPVLCANLVSLSRTEYFVLGFTCKGVISIGKDLTMTSVELDVQLNSLPVHVTSQSGLIFLAASSGNHQLFQIAERDPLKLEEITSLTNVAPVTASYMPKRQLLLGNASPNVIRVRPGIFTDEMASTPLPAKPHAVFTARTSQDVDSLIVISFSNDTTTTLAVGDEGSVEEISEAETGIGSDLKTLGISKLMVGLVQIHPQGFRHICGSPPKVTPWLTARNVHVLAHACTKTQVALALSDRSIVYFEEKEGSLHESQHRLKQKSNITALSFSQIPNSEIRSTTLLVALSDETLRQFSVPDWNQTELHILPEPASSVLHFGGIRGFIQVGHFNGSCSRIENGEVLTRVFGSTAVQLVQISDTAAIALSSRIWLLKEKSAIPLLGESTQGLHACHPFVTEDLPEAGLVGVKASSLEVFSLGDDFGRTGYTVELTDAGISRTKSLVKSALSNKVFVLGAHSELRQIDNNLSCISAISQPPELPEETPTASVNVQFTGHEGNYLVVAYPSQIFLYQYLENGLKFVHFTNLPLKCTALIAFEGRLLVAMANTLVLYDLGKMQLLRQGGIQLRDFACIKALQASHTTVAVGDSRNSVILVEIHDLQFSVVAHDPVPRCVACMILLDPQTVCIGDHYGNVAVLRRIADSGKPSQLQLVAHFRVADAIIALHLGTLSPVGGVESIIYVGLHGTVGIFIPFLSKSEHEPLLELERALLEASPLSVIGCSPSTFINCYTPVRNVIDGDFCEYKASLNLHEVAESLERAPTEVLNQLESLRLRSAIRTN